MSVRLLMLLVFVTAFAGCASTQKTSMSQMQMQVADLEGQLVDKDDEIADLRDELDRVSLELQRRARANSFEGKSGSVSKKDGAIIRVDVSVGQVQTALKNAGYYTGTVDGKLGGNTKSSIVQFQKDNNLNADGVLGRKTWEKLKLYLEE